jgi:hypothetical protein
MSDNDRDDRRGGFPLVRARPPPSISATICRCASPASAVFGPEDNGVPRVRGRGALSAGLCQHSQHHDPVFPRRALSLKDRARRLKTAMTSSRPTIPPSCNSRPAGCRFSACSAHCRLRERVRQLRLATALFASPRSTTSPIWSCFSAGKKVAASSIEFGSTSGGTGATRSTKRRSSDFSRPCGARFTDLARQPTPPWSAWHRGRRRRSRRSLTNGARTT